MDLLKSIRKLENRGKTPVEPSVEIVHFLEENPESYPQQLKTDSQGLGLKLFINSLSTAVSQAIVD